MNNAITYQHVKGNDLYYEILKSEDKERFKYLSSGSFDINDEYNIVAFQGDTPVGIMGLRDSPHEKDVIWMLFVSVDAKFQGRGIADTLVSMLFQYCNTHDKRIKLSSYSDMGELYLKKVFDRYTVANPDIEVKANDDYTAFTPR